ncbi:5-methylcytosine rRNA methyltransferase l(2)10685 [Brevipalpus obovatus]|uniref:5-methylcytosine rRNA methyltransferase l(2)10685 n=1 Tax=Brevipalpus obovatus TaxID=246614 RepID=UPI003D9EA088
MMIPRVSRRLLPSSCLFHVQIKNLNHMEILKRKLPTDFAMEHFDGFYSKVYQARWPSIRLGLQYETKLCAVVNPFTDEDETIANLKIQGAIELSEFYRKQIRRVERHKLRRKILDEKRAKKLAILAEKRGIKPEEIQSDVEVSDVSDAEIGAGSTTDSDDLQLLFETDIEAMRLKEGFMDLNNQDVDLYDFIPCSEMIYMENKPLLDPSTEFKLNEQEIEIERVEVPLLNFPDHPKIFAFPRGSRLQFETPSAIGETKLNNYYLMNGAEILPVITLNIQPQDKVADLCAAPGGQALAALFSQMPSVMFCCDSSSTKFATMKNFFNSYLPRVAAQQCQLFMESLSAIDVDCPPAFDKVLLHVPSTRDRESLLDNTDNIFKGTRANERIGLPERQRRLLKRGLQLLKVGGSLVYSTKSLSPIQNDAVVQFAITELEQEMGVKFSVDDLKEAYRPMRALYRMYTFNYGIQVLPFLPSNFGPSYFSKINRTQ